MERRELVAANSALAVLTDGAASELLKPPVNVLRLAVHQLEPFLPEDDATARILRDRQNLSAL